MTPSMTLKIKQYAEDYHNGDMKQACENIMTFTYLRQIGKVKYFIGWEQSIVAELTNPFNWHPAVYTRAMSQGLVLPKASRFWEYELEQLDIPDMVAIKIHLFAERKL